MVNLASNDFTNAAGGLYTNQSHFQQHRNETRENQEVQVSKEHAVFPAFTNSDRNHDPRLDVHVSFSRMPPLCPAGSYRWQRPWESNPIRRLSHSISQHGAVFGRGDGVSAQVTDWVVRFSLSGRSVRTHSHTHGSLARIRPFC